MTQQSRHPRAALTVLLVVVLGLAALPGTSRIFAQEVDLHPALATPTAGREPATVSVVGEGRIAVAPDTATFVAGVEIVRSTLSEAQAAATEQMAAVIDALVAAGIAEEDIQTVTYRVEVIQDRGPAPPEPGAAHPEPAAPQAEPAAPAGPGGTPESVQIRGFRVINQVRVQVRDVDRLGELLDAVVAEGANAIGGIQFSVTDPAEARGRARAEAVHEARRAAEDLADAAGLRLGDVLTMTEEGGASPRTTAEMPEAAGGEVPIQAGLVEIATSVRVTYALEPAPSQSAATPSEVAATPTR